MSPATAFRWRPLTFVSTALVGAWMLWFGAVLLLIPLPPARAALFRGPEQIMGVRAWGVAFLVGALCMIARLALFDRRHGFTLQVAGMLVVVGWAGAWYAGPLTTAQPAYSLIAILTIGLPYIHVIADRYLVVIPRRVSRERTDTAHSLDACLSTGTASRPPRLLSPRA